VHAVIFADAAVIWPAGSQPDGCDQPGNGAFSFFELQPTMKRSPSNKIRFIFLTLADGDMCAPLKDLESEEDLYITPG